MLPPVRCFTCNKVLAPYYTKHIETQTVELMTENNISRYCCRRMLLSSVDLTEFINSYNTHNGCVDEVDTSLTVLSKRSYRIPTK